jgi:hypothetical protein
MLNKFAIIEIQGLIKLNQIIDYMIEEVELEECISILLLNRSEPRKNAGGAGGIGNIKD